MTDRYVLRTSERRWSAIGPDVATSGTDVTTINAATSALGMDVTGSNLATVLPIGVTGTDSSDNKTFYFSLFGYTPDPSKTYWLGAYIGKFKATLGTMVGVSGWAAATQYHHFADKIELVDGDTSCRIISGENNTYASLTVDLAGATRLHVGFSDVGTVPTNVNLLVGLI